MILRTNDRNLSFKQLHVMQQKSVENLIKSTEKINKSISKYKIKDIHESIQDNLRMILFHDIKFRKDFGS